MNSRAAPSSRWERLPPGAIRVSSVRGEGIEDLLRAIVRRLIPSVPPEDAAVPLTERQNEALHAARTAALACDSTDCRVALGRLTGG